jgi:ParB family transcriptional regulator, chromosome partitioning protein
LRLERRSSADRRAVFVGAKAYGQAGGSVIRELFDAEGDGFFADAELLNRLAREKLQRHADKVADEGWRWVLAEPEFDHQASAAMRRVFAKPVPLSKAERRRLHKVQALFDALALEALAGAGSPVPRSVHILLRIRHERLPKGARLVRGG